MPVVEVYEEKKHDGNVPMPSRKDIEELFASITHLNKISSEQTADVYNKP